MTTVPNTTGVINSATAVSTTTSVTTSSGTVVYGTTVTFTAVVSANTGSVAPTQGNVDFKDTTTNTDFGNGTFVNSSGTNSTWTFTTGVKTFNFTTGDTIQAAYSGDAAFNGSNGSTTQIVNKAPLTISALSNTKTYDGTTSAAAAPTVVGLVGSDTVTGLSETYDNKNAGTGKTLTVAAGYTVSDGNGGGNYNVNTVPNYNGVINAGAVTSAMIDDSAGAPGWTTTGTWSNWTDQGCDGDVHQAEAADSTATWSFSNLDAHKYYQVEATWTTNGPVAGSNRASNAPYTISGGTVTLPVYVNQKLRPLE